MLRHPCLLPPCTPKQVSNAEVWANTGLSCFYAGQYDLTLPCFERALALADDGAAPDVWYNLAQVGAGRVGCTITCVRMRLCMCSE